MIRTIFLVFSFLITNKIHLHAHCQMPCGIYHDQMIYDKIDEYYETMYKAVSVLSENKMGTVQEKNQYIRWVLLKEKLSDETAGIITEYFLQQKLKPDDPDTFDLVKSAHKLLFLLVSIKQTVDLNIVKQFGREWEHFKSLFHPEMICHAPPPPGKEENKPNEKREESEVKETGKKDNDKIK